jgi:predicted CoA-binding protein
VIHFTIQFTPIDIVDVFRDPMHLGGIVDEAIAVGAMTLWAQLGVVTSNQEPERKAKNAGLKVVLIRRHWQLPIARPVN